MTEHWETSREDAHYVRDGQGEIVAICPDNRTASRIALLPQLLESLRELLVSGDGDERTINRAAAVLHAFDDVDSFSS